MTKEEKKAIETMQKFRQTGFNTLYLKYNDRVQTTRHIEIAIDTTLNLIEKQQNKLLEYEKQLDLDYVEQNYIRKDKITKILDIEEKRNSDFILKYLETIVDEWNRLEDIEDKKIQIEYTNVFNKGVKSIQNKIKSKINYYADIGDIQASKILEELLEETNEN